ncbi:hypothetical protein [Paludisphaera sp.]|uniref:hypothetical protein n=1 Tax=Paludisphaera sp. TaxID=2017432 RepID=UPI00301BAD62
MVQQRDEGPDNTLFFLAMAWGLLLSFRVFSLPLLLAGAFLARRLGRQNGWTIAIRGAFLLSLLSPVDVPGLGCYRGGGAHHSGPRLVRCVVGLPTHTSLIARHGEYYSLGCSGYTVNNPRWILVPR